ncbi:cytochrome c3 family protein [Sulfurimonas sp.]|uniref:cytochrome c3 family protein n=1 Tax=Sulfurimonas sp. TaxID=2022749 RepID=UPI0025E983C6|nr:cytochrome c3 family protein [Sulfurimonas sp.]
MKNIFNITLLTIAIILLSLDNANGGVVNTKHNMSTAGPGTIKATSEPEVCVFCHIPHSAQTGTPLWNRSMPASSYTMYNSDYMRRMNYPTPASLGNTVGTPGTLSRQCLSCHDGTVAAGSVYLVRGTLLGGTQIAMSGVNPDGTMLSSAAGYVGTDLRGHHPVGIEYNHTVTKNFGSGTRGIELLVTPGAAIKLYTYSGKQYVECSSCHDPHTETKKFLRYSAGGSHGANVYGTCTSCHDKANWATGAHATVTNSYTDATVNAAYETSTVSSLGCVNCHKPHNGEGKPYLLRKVEENTCFQGAGSGTTSTVPCHGTGGAKDIQTSLQRMYSHPTDLISGQHSNLDVLYGTGVVSDGGGAITWNTNKHAECTDCHNPHQAKAGSHIDPPDGVNTMYPSAPTNLISKSGPLRGAIGVEPTWPATGWTQPTSFTTLESATYEYQVCLKCHSQWALGSSATPVSSQTITKTGEPATDQAWEFNPKNKSAHPIVMSHEAMKIYGGNAAKNPAAEGRYADSLTSAYLKTPWSNNPGNNTMYCSDCHGADEQTSDPRGPHGSSYKYMLKGRGNYWPYKPNGQLWGIDDTTVDNPDLFCQNCHRTEAVQVHVFKSDRTRFNNMLCVNCHAGIPHGSKISRLMAYAVMPHPYNFNGNAKMKGFRALGAANYVTTNRGKGNHWTNDTTTCSCHGTAVGGAYDVYP